MNNIEPSWRYKVCWKLFELPKRVFNHWFWYTLFKKDNAYMIARGVKKYRNQLMLDDINGVIKLLGWTDQFDDDYYYIAQERRYGVVENVFLHSCVGWYTPLKRRLSHWEYAHIEHLWDLNTFVDINVEIKEKGLLLK